MNHLKFLFGSWSLAIGSVLILTAAASAQTAAMQRVNTWQRWEYALTSARQHDNPYADVALRVRYTGPDGRHLVARLFGNFVIFSPSFDSKFMPLADEVGLAARQATAVHLITQHPGTPSREPTPVWTMEYYDRPYLDIAGVQTGHNGGIWRWVTDPEKPDFWQKAIGWESSRQMQYLHDFLDKIEWWKLEPAHELIRNQPDDVTRRMVLAKVAGRDFAVACLPYNDTMEVNLSAFSAPVTARWFDPVRGHSSPVTGVVLNQGNHRFTPPAKGDWVLVIGQG